MTDTKYEARIQEMDQALAPGSETSLLGSALQDLRTSTDVTKTLAWWTGAYRYVKWAHDHPSRWTATHGDDWSDAEGYVLGADYWFAGWVPPTPAPSDLIAWRKAENLTQTRAASLAGVELRAWQRWESSERAVPQWLADTLTMRWGSGP